MANSKVQVVVDGVVVGERQTPRPYTCAVVAVQHQVRVQPFTGYHYAPCEPKVVVLSYHSRQDLALGALANLAATHGAAYMQHLVRDARVVPTTVVAIKTRGRVRCTGLKLQPVTGQYELTYQRTMQCTKDALPMAHPARCEAHREQDVTAVRAEAEASQEAHSAECQRRWDLWHAGAYTAETCRVSGCRVHVQAVAR